MSATGAAGSGSGGVGAPPPSAFPTTELMLASGLDAADRAAVRTLIALSYSRRAVADLEVDSADAKRTVSQCTAFSQAQLAELILLADVAVSLNAQGGGRRRRRQHGGGISDAVKRVLASLCDALGRGADYTTRTTEDLLLNLSVRIRSMSDRAVGQQMNRTILGIATSAALYNLQYGTDGVVGSLVAGLVNAIYAATPTVEGAVAMGTGAATVGIGAGVGLAAAYTGTAAVTYASAMIMRGLRESGRLARMLPNPTDPAQIHDALQSILEYISTTAAAGAARGAVASAGAAAAARFPSLGRINLGAYVFPRRAAPGGDAGRRAHPGEDEVGRAVNMLLLQDGALEAVVAEHVAQAPQMSDAALATAMGMSAARVAAIRQRNAARFAAPGGTGGSSSSSSGGIDEDGGGAGGMGGRGRRKTRKHHRRGRRHTRKH